MTFKIIHNVQTNEIIQEQLSDEELEQAKLNRLETDKEKELVTKQIEMKTELLVKLGLSEDEAKIFLS